MSREKTKSDDFIPSFLDRGTTKYKINDKLFSRKDGNFIGTVVVIEGNPPCRFYGLRNHEQIIGISMVRQSVLEDPNEYNIEVRNDT